MNTFSDPHNQLQGLEEKEVLKTSLQRLHKGDAQLIADSFPAFQNTPEVQTLLEEYRALQQRIYELWVSMGLSQPVLDLSDHLDQNQKPDELIDSEETIGQFDDRDFGAEIAPEIDINILAKALQENETNPDEPNFKDNVIPIEEAPSPEVTLYDKSEEPDHKEEVDHSSQELESIISGPDDTDDASEDSSQDSESSQDEGIDVENSLDDSEDSKPEDEDAIFISPDPEDSPPPPPSESHIVIPKRIRIDYPNGKVDTLYNYSIPTAQLNLDLDWIEGLETLGFAPAGLIFDKSDWTVKGLPEEQGQFSLEVHIEYQNPEGRKGKLILEGNCNINPDPRSLWQEHEPPADAPYPKSHTESARTESHEAILIGASRRGRSHAHKGDFRDDDFKVDQVPGTGWYILSVADGAGSAKYSREGSRLAVEVTSEKLQSILNDDFTQIISKELDALALGEDPQVEQSLRLQLYDSLVGAVFEGYKAILAEADQKNATPRDYATTLLLTVCRKFPQGWFFASYWVGDGCIGVYRDGEAVEMMGTPDGGEFAGQTRFFTMQEIWKDAQTILNRLQITLVPDFTALCLMTDGISDPKFQTDYNLRQVPRWDTFWKDLGDGVQFGPDNNQQDLELLEWLNFWSQGDHDDRTLVIMYPKGSEGER